MVIFVQQWVSIQYIPNKIKHLKYPQGTLPPQHQRLNLNKRKVVLSEDNTLRKP